MNKSIKGDYVIGLISGRMVKAKDVINNRMVKEFVPSKTNKYPTLKQIFDYGSDTPVDKVMVTENLRHRALFIDRGIFVKTPAEKEKLKDIKNQHHKVLRKAGLNPKKVMNLPNVT